MKKIGGVIVSDLNHTNYGSMLQAYATLKTVQNLGYELSFIKYKKQRNLFDWLSIAPGLMLSGGLELLRNRLLHKIQLRRYSSYRTNNNIRINSTNEFKRKEFVPYFKEYKGYKALQEGSKEYDAIFVGSDQVWRPFGFYSSYWNLMFADESVPKFSYSSSYGVSDIPKIQRKGTKKYLERLSIVSVREDKAKQIVEKYSNKKAKVVADPTMLFTKEQWEDFAKESTIKVDEPYIFCYFLGTRKDIRNKAKELSEKTGIKIVIMRHMDEYVEADELIGDYYPYDINPRDFVKLLMNAEYVCTDSFHGTVFSILMHKKFITFYRVNPKRGNSTHSRIDSLLNKFGLLDRLFKGNILSIRENIDYNRVDKIMKDFREDSMNFLINALAISK